MNLLDLANHICEQCGTKDTDDVAAAKLFLQRRLEMVWNMELWRSALLEATLTISPDGSCTLPDTTWNPATGILLLPAAMESVLAVRADNHAMDVSSLERYFRTDTNWLDMQGDPTEFQVLTPMAFEANQPVSINFSSDSTEDDAKLLAVVLSSNGVQQEKSSLPFGTNTVFFGVKGAGWVNQQQIISASKPPTIGTVTFQAWGKKQLTVKNNAASALTFQFWLPNNVMDEAFDLSPGESAVNQRNNFYRLDVLAGEDVVFSTSSGVGNLIGIFQADDDGSGGFNFSQSPDYFYTAKLLPTDTSMPVHCRIRLTTRPQVATNLRVLGKRACPELADYDEMPITNVESCLMAFGRADMLLRVRQNGKARIAMQEGQTLLTQLTRSEAFQTANNFRIVPDNGFGGDNVIAQPNSLHPL